jgi:hypothetical protein
MKPGLLCNRVKKRTYSARAASALSRDQPRFSIKASRTELSSSSSGILFPVFAENEAFTTEKSVSPTMKRIKIRIGIAFTASWRRQSAPVISLIYADILDRTLEECQVPEHPFPQIFTVNSQNAGRIPVLKTKPPCNSRAPIDPFVLQRNLLLCTIVALAGWLKSQAEIALRSLCSQCF